MDNIKISQTADMHHLPVPDLFNINLNHSFRQANKTNLSAKKCPPKIYRKNYDISFNRNTCISPARAVSFRKYNEDIDLLSTSSYNSQAPNSFFEQCFETLSKIGEGSFGEVFKVRSKDDGLFYAVKKSKQFFRSENYKQERLQEVRRYEEFSNSKHCVKLYKAWEQDDRLYMQMELCRCSLENYLAEKKKLSETKVWSFLLDLLLALKELHDRNLIHLDIKLDNILIDEDGYCKLGDFGLVVDVDRANVFDATEGDSRYIAPELLRGYFSKAADIFSLGISLLELSCNLELPPNGPLWQQLRDGILPKEFIKVISKELQDIIHRMMLKDPLQRPTVDELLNYPKIVSLLKRRQRWTLFTKFERIVRKSKIAFKQVLLNTWRVLCCIYFFIMNFIQFKPPSVNATPCKDFSDDSAPEDDILNDFNPNSSIIANSTPLNHHSVSLRKLKKYSSSSSAAVRSFDISPDNNNSKQEYSHESSQEFPILICKKLFDDFE